MKTHITPGELAKVMEVDVIEAEYRFSVYLDRDGFPKIISQEDALLAYIGSKLKDIGLNGYRIREICDWLREWLRTSDIFSSACVYEFHDPHIPMALYIPMYKATDAFNRKLKEVRDAK